MSGETQGNSDNNVEWLKSQFAVKLCVECPLRPALDALLKAHTARTEVCLLSLARSRTLRQWFIVFSQTSLMAATKQLFIESAAACRCDSGSHAAVLRCVNFRHAKTRDHLDEYWSRNLKEIFSDTSDSLGYIELLMAICGDVDGASLLAFCEQLELYISDPMRCTFDEKDKSIRVSAWRKQNERSLRRNNVVGDDARAQRVSQRQRHDWVHKNTARVTQLLRKFIYEKARAELSLRKAASKKATKATDPPIADKLVSNKTLLKKKSPKRPRAIVPDKLCDGFEDEQQSRIEAPEPLVFPIWLGRSKDVAALQTHICSLRGREADRKLSVGDVHLRVADFVQPRALFDHLERTCLLPTDANIHFLYDLLAMSAKHICSQTRCKMIADYENGKLSLQAVFDLTHARIETPAALRKMNIRFF